MSGRIYQLLALKITAILIAATLVFTGLLHGGTTSVTQQLRRMSTDVDLTGITLGLGGSGDGQGRTLPYNFGYPSTSEGLAEAAITLLQVVGALPNLGYKPPTHSVIPDGDTFTAVAYPAVIPFVDALFRGPGQSLAESEKTGTENMLKALEDVPAGEKLTIVSISQGTMVAERVRAELARRLANGEQNVPNPEFKMLGNPYRPDGGLLTRFAFLSPLSAILSIPFGRPGPADSPFKTTDYANQYDGFADFPKYANPLAIANALVGMAIQHGFPGYFVGDPNDPNRVETTVGNTTYVTFPKTLPLLAPFRIPLSLIGAQRFVDFIEPVLRVFVEMGYDRTADPSKAQQLQLFTPLGKVTEALSKLPAAIAQSLEILKTGKYTPTLPQPIVSPETSTLDKQSPAAGDDRKALSVGEKSETAPRLTIDVPAPSAKPSIPAATLNENANTNGSEPAADLKPLAKQVSAATTTDTTNGKRSSAEPTENSTVAKPVDTLPSTPADRTASSSPSGSDTSADGGTDKTDKVTTVAPVRVSTTSPKTKTLTSPKPATATPSTQTDRGDAPTSKSEPASATGSTRGVDKVDAASPTEKTTPSSALTGIKQSDKTTLSSTIAGSTSEKPGTSASTARENKSSPSGNKPSAGSEAHSGSTKESSASKESSSAKHTEKAAA